MRLQKAIEQSRTLGLEFQLIYTPFILRRHLSKRGVDKVQIFTQQFGCSEAAAQQKLASIKAAAAEDGLLFNPTGQCAGNSEV